MSKRACKHINYPLRYFYLLSIQVPSDYALHPLLYCISPLYLSQNVIAYNNNNYASIPNKLARLCESWFFFFLNHAFPLTKTFSCKMFVPWRLCSSHLDCLVLMWLAAHHEYALLAALCNILLILCPSSFPQYNQKEKEIFKK